jgi:hypothetical protein
MAAPSQAVRRSSDHAACGREGFSGSVARALRAVQPIAWIDPAIGRLSFSTSETAWTATSIAPSLRPAASPGKQVQGRCAPGSPRSRADAAHPLTPTSPRPPATGFRGASSSTRDGGTRHVESGSNEARRARGKPAHDVVIVQWVSSPADLAHPRSGRQAPSRANRRGETGPTAG